jgi:amidase
VFELHHLSALEQLDWLRRGEVTPRELAEHYLARIERLNDEVGAFVTVTSEKALERADAVAGTPMAVALWGLPLAENNIAEESDELAVALDDAGAISLGKTNTPEFGLPSYTEPLANHPARTPYDLTRGAGGSSGGAAAAVAAGLLPLAPGSDGGGSIRIPAASTGLVGLKPSRGRIPVGAGFSSLAGLVVPGPIARTVADAALLLDALVGAAPYRYATAAPTWDGGAFLNAAVRGEGRFQLGMTTSSPWETAYELELAPESRAALEVAAVELSAMGHGIEEFAFDGEEGYAPAFRTASRSRAMTSSSSSPSPGGCSPAAARSGHASWAMPWSG